MPSALIEVRRKYRAADEAGLIEFAGRSVEAKRALYAGIVTNLKAYGIPPDHVTILVRDLPTTNWGIRAGHAGSDLGFDINV